jgi:hypothetical protein
MVKKIISPAPMKPRPQPTPRQRIIAVVSAAIILLGLYLAGVFNLPFFTSNFGFQNTKNLHVNEITIGVPYAMDFGPSSLIPLLPPESTGGPYTFYLGSGVGFPPMGMILGIDGVLRGTPTTAGNSEFQVCVKDVGGRSACKTYQFTVNSGANKSVAPVKNTTKQPAKTCPATSCDTGGCCWSSIEDKTGGPGPHPAVQNVAVMVEKSCGCPSDTTLSPDQIGGSYPYKRCECNTNH